MREVGLCRFASSITQWSASRAKPLVQAGMAKSGVKGLHVTSTGLSLRTQSANLVDGKLPTPELTDFLVVEIARLIQI